MGRSRSKITLQMTCFIFRIVPRYKTLEQSPVTIGAMPMFWSSNWTLLLSACEIISAEYESSSKTSSKRVFYREAWWPLSVYLYGFNDATTTSVRRSIKPIVRRSREWATSAQGSAFIQTLEALNDVECFGAVKIKPSLSKEKVHYRFRGAVIGLFTEMYCRNVCAYLLDGPYSFGKRESRTNSLNT